MQDKMSLFLAKLACLPTVTELTVLPEKHGPTEGGSPAQPPPEEIKGQKIVLPTDSVNTKKAEEANMEKLEAMKKALIGKVAKPQGGGGAEGRIETAEPGDGTTLPEMPVENEKTAMEKVAFADQIWNSLSADQKMAVIGALLGGTTGAAYGALTPEEGGKKRLQRALIYGGAGAGTGALAGYFGNKLVNRINPGTKGPALPLSPATPDVGTYADAMVGNPNVDQEALTKALNAAIPGFGS